MDRANVNGVALEYEVRGVGEPVLLIDMLIADCFVPLFTEPALADGYQLIRYHKRGWIGSTHTPPPVSIGDHAADAAALLEHLGVRRAHIAGHSTGASIGAQLALDHPEKVHTLTLLEPMLVWDVERVPRRDVGQRDGRDPVGHGGVDAVRSTHRASNSLAITISC